MDTNQKKIVEFFIVEFLPPTGSRRKNNKNELDYITRTLDKVFMQNFGFKLTKYEITDYFSRLNHQIFYKVGIYDHVTKKIKPSFINEENNLCPPQFTYFDISSKTVHQLMLTTSKLSEITNSEKFSNTQKMKIKLEIFKTKTNHKRPQQKSK